MLARIAQELFWLGRDLTRAEHTARMLDGAFHADVAGMTGQRGIALSWDGVLAIIGAKPPVPGERAQAPATAAVAGVGFDGSERRTTVTSLLTLDLGSPASILSCVARARERGRTLRDVISTEMWQALNSFYLALGRYDMPSALQTGPYSVYQEVKERCALFWGLVDRTMLRDEGRAFLEAGGRIEEADMVLRMLRVTVPPEPQASPGEDEGEGEALALLQAVGGFQAYRRAGRSAPTIGRVVRFLLYDGAYPGSVASSVEALRDALTSADPQPRTSPPVLRLGRLAADLELQRRTPAEHGGLPEQLKAVQDELEMVDRDIGARYFAIAAIAAVHL
ncbi:MAG: alpha-E domain-containing protein [Solirubrobacteraceae bacterium]|jgi:uncharacterized alpha-E superfamily protein